MDGTLATSTELSLAQLGDGSPSWFARQSARCLKKVFRAYFLRLNNLQLTTRQLETVVATMFTNQIESLHSAIPQGQVKRQLQVARAINRFFVQTHRCERTPPLERLERVRETVRERLFVEADLFAPTRFNGAYYPPPLLEVLIWALEKELARNLVAGLNLVIRLFRQPRNVNPSLAQQVGPFLEKVLRMAHDAEEKQYQQLITVVDAWDVYLEEYALDLPDVPPDRVCDPQMILRRVARHIDSLERWEAIKQWIILMELELDDLHCDLQALEDPDRGLAACIRRFRDGYAALSPAVEEEGMYLLSRTLSSVLDRHAATVLKVYLRLARLLYRHSGSDDDGALVQGVHQHIDRVAGSHNHHSYVLNIPWPSIQAQLGERLAAASIEPQSDSSN